jgi:hypothetical protein
VTVKTPHSNSHDEILEKLRKLLRLADRSRGATEHEAKAALAKAHELMTRYNIDSAMLRTEREASSGGTDFKVNSSKVELPKTLNPADLLILSLLQSHFNVRVILLRGSKETPVDIIGAPLDVEYAVFVFNFLRETFFRCWNEFKHTANKADRKSYYRGLHDGLKAALDSARQRAESSYSAEQRSRYQIVLVDANAIIDRHVAQKYGKLRSRRQQRRRVDSESYVAGKSKGATIRINRPLPA